MKPSEKIRLKFIQEIGSILSEKAQIPIDGARNILEHECLITLILDFLDEKFSEDEMTKRIEIKPEGQSWVGKKIRKRDWTANVFWELYEDHKHDAYDSRDAIKFDAYTAFLPHSCDAWVIGGPEQIKAMIEDLQDIYTYLTCD